VNKFHLWTEYSKARIRWINRLSVAYGLSFVKTDLADNIYPKDLNDPAYDEIQGIRDKAIPTAPTKDEC